MPHVEADAPGHRIQDCPTNSDREFDNKPRLRRTTGIPRSFLKTIEGPPASQIGRGVMVTPEGGYVIAEPDAYARSIFESSASLRGL